MNKLSVLIAIAAFAALPAAAKDKTPDIASNTSSVSDNGFINSIVTAAKGMGAQEPLDISETQAGGKRVLVVTGSNGTRCQVPTSDGNPPKMTGINCK